MSLLIKEYDIPVLSFVGKIELIEATGYDKSFNGEYYAKSEKKGTLVNHCESLDELNTRLVGELESLIEQEKLDSQKVIKEEERQIFILSSVLTDIRMQGLDYLKKHQTQNLLQLEYQEENKNSNPLRVI